MASGWYNEPRRHGLAAKGIKTAIDHKPINRPLYKYSDTVTKPERQILDILDNYHINWSYMGDVIFVNKGQQGKIIVVRDELNKVSGIKQGFDEEGNYIAYEEKAPTEKECFEGLNRLGVLSEEGSVKFGYKIDEVWEGQQTYTPEEYEKKKELDAAIKKQGLKFFSVLHGEGYPDDAKTFVIEHTQQARLLAKDEKDARKQVKKAYGTGILEVSEIDDQDEIDELKRMILKQEK